MVLLGKLTALLAAFVAAVAAFKLLVALLGAAFGIVAGFFGFLLFTVLPLVLVIWLAVVVVRRITRPAASY